MSQRRINHVSIAADDLDASARFYQDVFGMEPIATPNFGSMEVRWLLHGDQQLHLFRRSYEPPRLHHLGLDVEDFEAVYVKAKELGILDGETFGAPLRRHPAGWVQMYLRDPAGNLVEVDWPDASTLDRSVVTELPELDAPQEGEQLTATLYHEPARSA